jgi:preprotein translocase subunit SecG
VSTFLIALHVIACLVLILVVLLQRGKGSDMGAALGGGGSNTVFGSRGAGNFLTKLTSGCAVVFMVTSLSLAYLGSRDTNARVFDNDEQANPTSQSDLLEEVDPSSAPGDDGASADALEEIPLPGDDAGGASDEEAAQ